MSSSSSLARRVLNFAPLLLLLTFLFLTIPTSESAPLSRTIRSHKPILDQHVWKIDSDADRPSPHETVSLSFVLESEIPSTELEARLFAVSTPSSPQYLHYPSRDEVMALGRPSEMVRENWSQWLKNEVTSKYSTAQVEWNSLSHQIIRLRMSVREMESFLGHELHSYTHSVAGVRHIRASLSSDDVRASGVIPSTLVKSLSHVAGVTSFPMQVEMVTNRQAMRQGKAARADEFSEAEDYVPEPVILPVPKSDGPLMAGDATEKKKPSKLAANVGDWYGQQQILNNVVLYNDDASVSASIVLACDTPIAGSSPWTFPTTVNGRPQCQRAEGLIDYSSTTLVLSQVNGQQVVKFTLNAADVPVYRSSKTGRAFIQVKLKLPTNYDGWTMNILFYYSSNNRVYQTSFDYPFPLIGMTRVFARTPSQYYGVPDQLTRGVSDGARSKERMSIAALGISEVSMGFYDLNDMSDYYFANSLNTDNTDLISYIDGSRPMSPLNPSNPDIETTLDISTATGANMAVRMQVLHIAGTTDTPFEDMLNLALADSNIHVLSISYGIYEQLLGASVESSNQILMKLGLAGVSVFASSGDTGSFFTNNRNGTCSSFQPSFPASSPYLTSVGGSTLTRGPSSSCPIEVAASLEFGSGITTGGGFSTMPNQKQPSYQTQAVAQWAASTTCTKPTQYAYDATGRAYPDVSLLAHNYDLYFQSGSDHISTAVDGTSASSPVLAGIISQYNTVRLSVGLPPLGFLNPLLYSTHGSNPSAFNDITEGSTKCLSTGNGCCQDGFVACAGFDPVTGLGSPNFNVLGDYLIPNITIPKGVSNNYFPSCPNFVALSPVDWPGSSSNSGKIAAVALTTIGVILILFLIVRFGLRRYHQSKYGSGDIRPTGPSSSMPSGPGHSLHNVSQPSSSSLPNRNWGPGHRLGNDLQQPLSRDGPSDV